MKSKLILSLVLSLLLSTPLLAQMTLSAAAPSNGSGGVFLTLTTNSSPVNISKFNTYFASTAVITVEVYTRTGAYSGFTTSNTGWTLLGTATATGAGTTTIAPLDVTALNIQIPAATTQSFYLHSITAGGGIRYTGTASAPPVTLFSDANLSLFSDVARTGTVAFAGNSNSPRTYAGSVEYFLTPLSLKWLSISAKNQMAAVAVNWEVEESEVAKYELEKETAGGHLIVATLTSKGNGQNSYSATDPAPFVGNAAVAAYRIKQYDKNGSISYSTSVTVRKPAEATPLQVFPNPFSNSIWITASEEQPISVEDITGKTVSTVTLSKGHNHIQTHHWHPGVYFIRSTDGRSRQFLKH